MRTLCPGAFSFFRPVEPPMSLLALADLPIGSAAILVGVIFVAGLARGFSGFGAALIYMPLASALVGPKMAAVSLLIADAVMTLPMLPHGWRNANRREAFLMLAGAIVGIPIGALALSNLPPLVLRWGICFMVFAMLALLISGWRYRSNTTAPLTVVVGAISGFCGGAAQLGGPAVVAYWLGGALPAFKMRASIVAYFGMATVISAITYYGNGLFVVRAFALAVIVGIPYGLGLFLGSRLFGFASEQTFRRICLGLIAAAGLLGLPIFG